MNIRAKLILVGLILITAVAYLAAAGMRSGWVYYLEVDRFLDDAQYRAQRVRLHGKVDASDFQVSPGSLSARFTLLGHTRKLSVAYHGPVPDQFQAGRDVVVEGSIDNANTFQADVLMTKCSSKYDPNSPHSAEKQP